VQLKLLLIRIFEIAIFENVNEIPKVGAVSLSSFCNQFSGVAVKMPHHLNPKFAVQVNLNESDECFICAEIF